MHKEQRGICIAALGSITNAVKAQRVLAQVGITGEILPLDAAKTRRGCAYGLRFACHEQGRVRPALRAAGIAVSQFLQEGDDHLDLS